MHWSYILLALNHWYVWCVAPNMSVTSSTNEGNWVSLIILPAAVSTSFLGHPNWSFNSSPPGQNGRHFPDDIFKCIFLNEKFCILITISLKFVHNCSIDNKPSIALDNGLAPNRRQAIIWPDTDLIHWHIYAAPGGDQLKKLMLSGMSP